MAWLQNCQYYLIFKAGMHNIWEKYYHYYFLKRKNKELSGVMRPGCQAFLWHWVTPVVVWAYALHLKEQNAFHNHLLTVMTPRSMSQSEWQHCDPHENSLCLGICLQYPFSQFLAVWASWASVHSSRSWGSYPFHKVDKRTQWNK